MATRIPVQSALTILLVDDDELVVASLAQGLRRAGYKVHDASSGTAALALADRTHFDLAIIDIHMPDMSGIELTQQLHERWAVPVLFLSAYCDDQTVADAVAAGAVGYMVKPVAVAQLMPALQVAQARARDLDALLQNKTELERVLGMNRDTSAAVGIMMERHNLSRQQAFDVLRAKARARGCRLETLAGELVDAEDRRNRLSGLTPD